MNFLRVGMAALLAFCPVFVSAQSPAHTYLYTPEFAAMASTKCVDSIGAGAYARPSCACILGAFRKQFSQPEVAVAMQTAKTLADLPPAMHDIVLGCVMKTMSVSTHSYDSSLERAFNQSCGSLMGTSKPAACGCAYHKIEARYTQVEYLAMAQGIDDGNSLPPEVAAIFAACK